MLHRWLSVSIAVDTPRDAVTNLGTQAIASQGFSAHATAGSGVSFTAGSEDGGKHVNANSSNVKLFKPSSVHKSGSSIAFTDVSQGSSAVAGIGEPDLCVLPAQQQKN